MAMRSSLTRSVPAVAAQFAMEWIILRIDSEAGESLIVEPATHVVEQSGCDNSSASNAGKEKNESQGSGCK